jgi:hypothetical protein
MFFLPFVYSNAYVARVRAFASSNPPSVLTIMYLQNSNIMCKVGVRILLPVEIFLSLSRAYAILPQILLFLQLNNFEENDIY